MEKDEVTNLGLNPSPVRLWTSRSNPLSFGTLICTVEIKIPASEGEEELDQGTCMKLPGNWLELKKQTVSPAAKLLPGF